MPPRLPLRALRAVPPHIAHWRALHAHTARARLDVAELDERAARLAATTAWTDGSEAQAVDVLAGCDRLCQQAAGLGAAEMRRVCGVADRLGQAVVEREIKAVPARVFACYVEFYARLARPDIAQQAFGRLASRWRRPPMAVCSAQLLALLRLAADGAAGGRVLRRTTDDPAAVRSRLKYRTAREVVESELRRERWLRRATKLLEYGSYGALGVLLAKWLWIGNSVVPVGAGAGQRALAMGASMALAAACVRLVLRHSVMGFLTAPAAGRPASNTDASMAQLSPASDGEARRILRRAFPASPSEREMEEISEMLFFGTPKMSWRLRLALAWSRFARRLAVVEPALLSTHGLRQRLATMWAHSLLHMFPDHERTDLTERAADDAVAELARFVREGFALVPLGLSQTDVVELAAFVASEAGSRALGDLMGLAAGGFLGICRATAATNAGDFLANWRAADEALLAASTVEVARRRAAAQVLVLTALLGRLARLAAGGDPTRKAMLALALQAAVDAAPSAPLSASLLWAAFAASEVLANDEMAAQLVRALESRFAAREPYILHMLRGPAARGGWRLHSNIQEEPPIVGCITPHLRVLVCRAPASVDGFVGRWRELGILVDSAPIHCLASAADSLLSQMTTSSTGGDGGGAKDAAACARRWAELGCGWASMGTATGPDSIVAPLSRLLLSAMDVCVRVGDTQGALSVFAAWLAAARQRPALRAHSTQDFNRGAVHLLASLTRSEPGSLARVCLRQCLDVLDLMRDLDQTPVAADFDAVRAAATRMSVDIARHTRYWVPVLKRSTQSARASTFAQSLL
ncbi:hypothetical protein LPJ61_003710 [Coemansia biformis]|uniref:Uncharacterized protein n=1 Tax=Coemansia biformis TaxID=1286918 RepID=A0A9W8CXZ1_9FUNG|nr:hypothetical protein LPJ61_003710 [Coemansia biformis]